MIAAHHAHYNHACTMYIIFHDSNSLVPVLKHQLHHVNGDILIQHACIILNTMNGHERGKFQVFFLN